MQLCITSQACKSHTGYHAFIHAPCLLATLLVLNERGSDVNFLLVSARRGRDRVEAWL